MQSSTEAIYFFRVLISGHNSQVVVHDCLLKIISILHSNFLAFSSRQKASSACLHVTKAFLLRAIPHLTRPHCMVLLGRPQCGHKMVVSAVLLFIGSVLLTYTTSTQHPFL